MNYSALCFIDMPFGKKTDLASGTEIDFDQIYQSAIKPAIEEAGLEALRGDEERSGGVIHSAMFARLLLAEYVVADLTLANPNVFYELGIRHAAKPFTTVPIFADTHPLPFDVGMIRAVVYKLENGQLTPTAAEQLKNELKQRLRNAIEGPATKDSPLFELLPEFPGIDLPHDVTDAFQDRVQHHNEFQKRLDQARASGSNATVRTALLEIQHSLGDLHTVQRNVLVDLLLSYRAVEAWQDMVALCEAFPDYLAHVVMVRQQWAFALNRRNQPGDRDQAIRLLESVINEQGPDPETLGILGRVHKDRYRTAKKDGSIIAAAALDDAIDAYTKGFESDPRDYYPGVNAITLLIEKGDDEALNEAQRLAPLVNFAVARRGGASSSNYWDLATVLELACVSDDWKTAGRVLPKVIAAAKESWMIKTTLGNLRLLQDARRKQGNEMHELAEIMRHFEEAAARLGGS